MELQYNNTKLTKISDIKIPDIFNRRLKTGISKIDELFDEGVLPGSALTLTASAGCGKTTFMLQVLQGMTKNGYSVGYFSGEESIYQLAYTANRIGVTDVQIANETDIDVIKRSMEDLDVVVVDSFQALSCETKMNSRQLEKHAVQTLTKHAKQVECTVVFIMHLTKSGDLKGGTIVPHTVDANLKIMRVADSDNDDARVIYFEKNRFGPLNELECVIGRGGYDFDAEVVKQKDETKAPSKKQRLNQDYDAILQMIESNKICYGHQIVKLMDGNTSKAYSRIRDLTNQGKIEKFGRGAHATFYLNSQNTEDAPALIAAQTR